MLNSFCTSWISISNGTGNTAALHRPVRGFSFFLFLLLITGIDCRLTNIYQCACNYTYDYSHNYYRN